VLHYSGCVGTLLFTLGEMGTTEDFDQKGCLILLEF
jgi:hypothetical protein